MPVNGRKLAQLEEAATGSRGTKGYRRPLAQHLDCVGYNVRIYDDDRELFSVPVHARVFLEYGALMYGHV